MLRNFLLLGLTLVLFGCNNSEIEGYKLSDKGFYFKLLGIGELNKYVTEGSYVTFIFNMQQPMTASSLMP
jgi:uncharacterized membrane protein YiaA